MNDVHRPVTAAPSATTAATAAAATTEGPPPGDDAAGSGLSVDPSTGEVDGPRFARAISDVLTRPDGRASESVTYPDVPATSTCWLSQGDGTYDTAARVTEVQSDGLPFELAVADQPS